MRRRQKGFTLLELIIVIIVIGILASIALPRFLRVTEKARVAEAKSSLGVIRSAQLRYKAQYGNYSGDINALDTDLDSKYFSCNATDGTGSIVGTCSRLTAVEYGLAAGDYDVEITEDGQINVSNPALSYLL